MDFFKNINSHKYIYLVEINEPVDNSLRLIINEASVNKNSVSIEDTNLTASAIQSKPNSPCYEIIFESYIGFSIIDESFAIPNDHDIFEGRLFCIYEKSTFLDYISKASFASQDYPGPFEHYGFNCLNHIVDIASCEKPIIKLLSQ